MLMDSSYLICCPGRGENVNQVTGGFSGMKVPGVKDHSPISTPLNASESFDELRPGNQFPDAHLIGASRDERNPIYLAPKGESHAKDERTR